MAELRRCICAKSKIGGKSGWRMDATLSSRRISRMAQRRLSREEATRGCCANDAARPDSAANGAGEGKAMRDARRRKEAEDMERFF